MTDRLDWDRDGRDWPNRQASRFVPAAGLRWHVQRMGEGPGLLLLHGTGASTHSWRALMPLLAEDFSCVAIDLPGHAFTEMPPSRRLSLEGMAEDVSALMTSLSFAPAVVVGHSAGAAIGVQMCLEGRVDPGLVVSLNGAFLPLSGLPGLVFPPIARAMAATPIVSRLFAWSASDRRAVLRLIRKTGSTLDGRGVDLYARLVRDPVHAGAALAMMARWDLSLLPRRIGNLKPLLHLVAAGHDLAVPAAQSRRVHRLVENSIFTLLEGVGHLAHEERPAQVAALLKKSAESVRLAQPA